MQRKRTVDRRRIIKRVEDMMKEFSTIYNDLDIVYGEEIDAVKASQAQKHDVGEREDI